MILFGRSALRKVKDYSFALYFIKLANDQQIYFVTSWSLAKINQVRGMSLSGVANEGKGLVKNMCLLGNFLLRC